MPEKREPTVTGGAYASAFRSTPYSFETSGESGAWVLDCGAAASVPGESYDSARDVLTGDGVSLECQTDYALEIPDSEI